MTAPHGHEEDRLRSVAIQNAQTILAVRQRAEQELVTAKEALEWRTQELAHSIAALRATLDATTDGLLVTDAAARVTDCNERYLALWGLERDRVIGNDHRCVVGQIGPQILVPAAFLRRVDEIYASWPADTLDLIELTEGRILERASRLQVIDGRPVGRVWSYRDITERRRSEEMLRDETRVLEILNRTGITLASELGLEALLQAVTDAATQLSGARFGAFFFTAQGDQGEQLNLYTLSGAPREAFEKLGHPRPTAIFGPIFRGEGTMRIDDVTRDSRYGTMAPHHGMPPGHLPVRSYLAVPVYARTGEVLGGLFFGHPDPGVFTERTERLVVGVASQASVAIDNARLYDAARCAAEERERLLKSERAARAEAERMSDMKDEFLATLSHELRTPLSAILGWAHVLRRGARTQAELAKGLEAIDRNARMQTQLIEDLLDMSRITAGKLRLDLQTVEPSTVVEAAIETVRPAADAKGILLETVVDPEAGPVSGDPVRLQQVVWNLLSNAIKFTPKDGRVQVRLTRVDSRVEISVSDTGIGIPSAFLDHAFERFRQADASPTRKFGGLGLGLSIVRHLVELHGGCVRAESPGEGAGATFTVELPVAVAERAGRIVRARPHSRAGSPNAPEFHPVDLEGLFVLVVDDEQDARELIGRVLADCGARVIAASSAQEAIDLYERERPDLLISDIGMPGIDGYELLRRIRGGETSGGVKVPAIALTAFARSEDRTRALRAGYLVHLSKPVEPSELVATVASVAGRMG